VAGQPLVDPTLAGDPQAVPFLADPTPVALFPAARFLADSVLAVSAAFPHEAALPVASVPAALVSQAWPRFVRDGSLHSVWTRASPDPAASALPVSICLPVVFRLARKESQNSRSKPRGFLNSEI
jgi:hypothetical protein